MIYEENRVRRGKTLWSNVLTGAAAASRKNIEASDLIKAFKPALVISDFESWTYLYGKVHRLPVVSIDNMQVINRCTHEPDILARGGEFSNHARVREGQASVRGPLRHHVVFEAPIR